MYANSTSRNRPLRGQKTKVRASAASYLLVALQLGSSLTLTVSGPLKPAHWWIALGPVGGVILAAWALLELRHSRLSVLPHIKPGATLVTSGPYRLMRHPMYASLLLVFVPLTVNHPTQARWAALGVLSLSLFLKMGLEERLLRARFPEYGLYAARTRKIIPWIY